MILLVQKSFEKDILKVTDKKIAGQLKSIIAELEACKTVSAIRNLKKMTGKGNYYRIRLGNFRIGVKIESDTIYLLRFMNRKEIYKYFP
jgi:mRNA interferase RelE/StbE